MTDQVLLSAGIAALFALIHLFGERMRFLQVTPRSVWLSVSGGVSVAYVFVHLLPELSAHQATLGARAARAGGPVAFVEPHAYLVALLGLTAFYGLDRLARQSAREQAASELGARSSAGAFWIHLGAFAMYNMLIAYLLLHREDSSLRGLLSYAAAMALHFVVNDQGLRQHHGLVYDRSGRWILAGAPLAGWLLGFATTISDAVVATLFAFLAGGVVLNVLKEELPQDRESRFWAFAMGVAGYAAVLLGSG